MASPMVDGRVEPHRKATYAVEVSEAVRTGEGEGFSGVKYNHKPSLAAGTRSTTLAPAANTHTHSHTLALRDTPPSGASDVFVFNGSRSAPTNSYVLVFDQTTQRATLDRLPRTYTFNLASHNSADASSRHAKIYPRKPAKDSVHDASSEDDLFGPAQTLDDDLPPAPDNPYDFRHFLNAAKTDSKDKAKDHGQDRDATPDRPTPSQPQRNNPAAKKRKAPSLFTQQKPAAKAKPPPKPIQKTTTTTSTAAKAKGKAKTAEVPASKIKSSEFIAPSDDSDVDAEGEVDSTVTSPRVRRASPAVSSPAPSHNQKQSYNHHHSSSEQDDNNNDDDDEDDDEDEERERNRQQREEDDSDSDDGLQIEFPDRPSHSIQNRLHPAPSPGRPISLASAASSVRGTPLREEVEEIDFGHVGGDGKQADEDGGGDGDADGDEDALYMEMMEGLAGGDSSEESEEE